MQIIPDEFRIKTGRNELITLSCPHCKINFKSKRFLVQRNIKAKRLKFCSLKCAGMHQQTRLQCKCEECGIKFSRVPSRAGYKNFCSQTCSGRYNNKHKAFGIRRSKLEVWLESKLTQELGSVEIHFNKKSVIGSELDIYIPMIKTAFELNGIYHYVPIHGIEILKRIQKNDDEKLNACKEKSIELIVIDVSNQKRFKENTSTVFLNTILQIVNQKLQNMAVA